MEGRRLYIFTVAQIVAVLAWFWILFTRPGAWNVQRYVVSVLTVLGAALLGVSRYQLGKSFSIKPEARQLITHGIYSRIRNPIYVCGAVMIVGLILVLQIPILWIGLAVVVTIQTIRAHQEARVLEAKFGDTYREYRSKTWF